MELNGELIKLDVFRVAYITQNHQLITTYVYGGMYCVGTENWTAGNNPF